MADHFRCAGATFGCMPRRTSNSRIYAEDASAPDCLAARIYGSLWENNRHRLGLGTRRACRFMTQLGHKPSGSGDRNSAVQHLFCQPVAVLSFQASTGGGRQRPSIQNDQVCLVGSHARHQAT